MKKPGKIIRGWLHQLSALKAFLIDDKRIFMNLGYMEKDSKEIQSIEVAQRNLYSKLIQIVGEFYDTSKIKSALEIGCGRGGGCELIRSEMGIRDIVGLDRVLGNVLLARRRFPEIQFVQGDACHFHIEKKFDLVLNLESAHAYSDLERFVRNVKEQLNTGAVFAFGDLLPEKKWEQILTFTKNEGFELLHSESISAGVITSLRKKEEQSTAFFYRFPQFFPALIHNFFVSSRSSAFQKLSDGKSNYLIMVFRFSDSVKQLN